MDYRSRIMARLGATAIAGVVMTTTLFVGPLVPAVAADATIGTTTTLGAASLNPKPTGRTSDIAAVVTPASGADVTGTITLYYDDNGTPTKLGEQPVSLTDGQYGATFTLAADLAEGTYHLTASYGGDATFLPSSSDPVTVVAGPRPTSTTVSISGPHDASGASAQKGDSITIKASVLDTAADNVGSIPVTGTVTIAVDNVTKGSFAVNGQLVLSTTSWALGSHTVKATYASDDADHAGSNGTTSITIVANVVEASGIAVQYATFYPYKDGYRDTVALKGNRAEPISVTIRIYSPTGKLVRTFTVAQAKGPFSVAWNGRTAAGTALAAGKYKVVFTLTDAVHGTKVVTLYTTISMKRLYTYTKSITKDYAHRSAQGTYSVAWEFTLPAATVYKKLVFAVYAKSSPAGAFGPHDFSYCGRAVLALDCGYPAATIGSTLAWRSVTGSVSYNRSGTFTRLYAVAQVRTNLKQGRVTVTYGILK